VLQHRGEGEALQAAALMQQGTAIELSASLALAAARVSHQLRLPMAGSVMLATAQAFDATFWTQDADFERVAGVKYVPKRPAR
jgi:predicted nucleic acid-binding protein